MEIKNLCKDKNEKTNDNIVFEINKNRLEKKLKSSGKISFKELSVPTEIVKPNITV